MNSVDKLPNYQIIQNGMYIVRTQAGLRQAGIHFCGDSETYKMYNIKNIRIKSYPSLVVFGFGYEGYHYLKIRSIHINKLKPAIQDA